MMLKATILSFLLLPNQSEREHYKNAILYIKSSPVYTEVVKSDHYAVAPEVGKFDRWDDLLISLADTLHSWTCVQYGYATDDVAKVDKKLKQLGTRSRANVLFTFSEIKDNLFICKVRQLEKKASHYNQSTQADTIYYLFQIDAGETIFCSYYLYFNLYDQDEFISYETLLDDIF